jgi:hypothetical protein
MEVEDLLALVLKTVDVNLFAFLSRLGLKKGVSKNAWWSAWSAGHDLEKIDKNLCLFMYGARLCLKIEEPP